MNELFFQFDLSDSPVFCHAPDRFFHQVPDSVENSFLSATDDIPDDVDNVDVRRVTDQIVGNEDGRFVIFQDVVCDSPGECRGQSGQSGFMFVLIVTRVVRVSGNRPCGRIALT